MRKKALFTICLVSLAATSSMPVLAAKITVDQKCYGENQEIKAELSGFTPNATLNTFLDDEPLEPSTLKTDGTFPGVFTAPNIDTDEEPTAKREIVPMTLSASDGVNQAETTVSVVDVSLGITVRLYRHTSPSKYRARLSGAAVAIGKKGRPVYAHVTNKKGKLLKVVRVGKTTDICGRWKTQGAGVRVFDFKGFNMNKTYRFFFENKRKIKSYKAKGLIYYDINLAKLPRSRFF